MSEEMESRLIRGGDLSYDQNGNPYTEERIGDIEIVNVPETMRFVRLEDLGDQARQVLMGLLQDALPHPKSPNDDLSDGAYCASCLSWGSDRSAIPVEIFIGKLKKVADGKLQVVGNIRISFHSEGKVAEPELVGFEIESKDSAHRLRFE